MTSPRSPIRRLFGLALSLAAALAVTPPGYAQGDDMRRLPDGIVTRAGAYSAYLIAPTTRYRHGVLGDAIEAGGFAVEHKGRRLVYRLGEDAVFEDRLVRLADLDGDGIPEAIVVKTYLNRGAALAVYAIGKERIAPMAESAALGIPNRWLNPVGVADFRGSGEPMIAAVLTPHLNGSLRVFRLAGDALVEAGRLDGVTNHIIGSRDLALGAVDDVAGDGVPQVVLPTRERGALVAVSFRAGQAAITHRQEVPGKIVAVKSVRRGKATLTLDNGRQLTVNLRGR